jgi:hypothetical protein
MATVLQPELRHLLVANWRMSGLSVLCVPRLCIGLLHRERRLPLGSRPRRHVARPRCWEDTGRATVDSDRFDAVVRALAARASRRETLQAAAGLAAASVLALVRTGVAGAHHARIPLGGACRHTSQCLHHAPTSRRVRPNRQSVYCADNGFRHDGPFNCCRTGGGTCTRNTHCCGRRHCRGGLCTYLR